jgi:ADP-ribosylglycohydrolase
MDLAMDLAKNRLERAYLSLDGLAIGDGFGERWFFVAPEVAPGLIQMRALPAPIWDYTDDTQMALSLVSVLRQEGQVHQDKLALSFAKRYNPHRKYGASMRGLFLKILDRIPWQQASASLFEGQGSYGNGAAMRVGPLGAYFADDLDLVVEQARRSAEVTHQNLEGIAGAVAVAVAAAIAWRYHDDLNKPNRREFIEQILPFVPESEVRSKLRLASELVSTSIGHVVSVLGNGLHISAQDTVPFCLWCAGEHLDSYEDALWTAASAYGDIDTTCAIIGGIVVLSAGLDSIPEAWKQSRESLPSWPFLEPDV